jgi:hypothetical protein
MTQPSCVAIIELLHKFLVASLLSGFLVSAQSGHQVVPSISVHQYSGISPLSANTDKLHTFDIQGHARIVRLRDGKVISDSAPYPEAHWDNVDDDLMWLIGSGGNHSQNRIETWRPSNGRYQTVIDYRNRFVKINTGATSDISYDDWAAFWAETEHNLCAVNLKAKKTYCIDYQAADPANLAGPIRDVDYVAVTPRDSKSGLRYVLMMAQPAMGIFSVNEQAGVLRWVLRPEQVFPAMGHKGNNDGICNVGESCVATPHADILTGPDGQIYLVTGGYGMEDGKGVCEAGEAVMRINAGPLMTKPENFAGVTGGGLKYIHDFSCGVAGSWSADHNGCARFGSWCVHSFESHGAAPPVGRAGDLWLLSLDNAGSIVYKRLGATGTSGKDYWSTPRASLAMDASQVIYDSDAGSNDATHAVYMVPTGVSVTKP